MGDTRTTTIKINNSTSLDLQLSGEAVSPGKWKTYPPSEIKDGETTKPFEAVAGVDEHGVVGSVVYDNFDGQFTFGFTNPNQGPNTYSEKAPPNYSITASTGAGEVADVTYTIESAPTTR